MAFLTDKPGVADAAVFGAVVLFARAWGVRQYLEGLEGWVKLLDVAL